MWASLAKNWFLAALGLCFTAGYLAGDFLYPLLEVPGLRSGIVFGVMWTMGVTLKAETVRQSFTRPLPSILAVTVNMFVVPLLCLSTIWLFPEKWFGGLFVASIVPCTLASASVWTRKAGGDDSIAMMTTVVTNLACAAVVPIGIALVLSRQTQIDVVQQAVKLGIIVVAPLVLAQMMRQVGWAAWADRYQSRLSALGQAGILTMVVFGAIAGSRVAHSQLADSALADATLADATLADSTLADSTLADSTLADSEMANIDRAQSADMVDANEPPTPLAGGSPPTPLAGGSPLAGGGAIAWLVIAVALIHTTSLGIGVGIARAVGLDRPRQIAIGIAGSQKTLMVGLQIAIDCSVSVIPMLVYHLSQLVIDTVVAQRWAGHSPPDHRE